MCQLCSNDDEEKTRARKAAYFSAEQHERMAQFYRGLADGHIKPHSEKAKSVGLLACALVRNLVEEWV